MKLVKPLGLSCIHRVVGHRQKHLFVASVAYCFPFDRPAVPTPEPELWKTAGTDLGRFGVLDHWMPKPQAEVLVTGACYPPSARGEDYVRVSVGPPDRRLVDKRLHVYGDRHWTLLGPSEPEPFTRMPIDHSHAFGGATFAANPLGKGFTPEFDDTSGASLHPLPNVEDPRHEMQTLGDRPPPATLSPSDPSWHRAARGDKREADFAAYNVAAPDQRVKGFFEGTEEIHLEHMHPEKRIQETRLPGYRARCFLQFRETVDPAGRLLEVTLNLDTIHLFPHRERGIVVFRGVAEIHTRDASDVALCLAALDESAEGKRPLSHFEEVVARRLDHETGRFHSLRDHELMPASSEPRDRAEVDEAVLASLLPADVMDDFARRARAEYEGARAKLVLDGMDPELIPPPAGEVADDALDEARIAEVARAHGVDIATNKEEMTRGGPPTFSADAEIAKLEEMARLGEASGLVVPGVRERLADPSLRTQLVEIQRRLWQAYRMTAHLQPGAPAAGTPEAEKARAELRAVMLGTPRDRRDFTGVDLSGEDLHGIDLEGAFLEGANLRGANLSGANLKDVVLARADLEGAVLDDAILDRANLGRVCARGASFVGASLREAVLYEADLREADLEATDLTRANTLYLDARGASFAGAAGEQLLFVKAKLTGASFRGSRMTKCAFIESDATEIDCAGADLSESSFVSSTLDRASFKDAALRKIRAVESSFAEADLRGASLPGSNLRGTKLCKARLTGANIRKSDLGSADLSSADLGDAIASECLFIDADLSGARLRGANLVLAIMHRARLEGADVSEANLFCADLTGAVGDEHTTFAGSNVARALVAGITRKNAADGEGDWQSEPDVRETRTA